MSEAVWTKETVAEDLEIWWKVNGDHLLEFLVFKPNGWREDGTPAMYDDYGVEEWSRMLGPGETAPPEFALVEGFIKWDGCTQWSFRGGPDLWHEDYHDPPDEPWLGRMQRAIWALGSKIPRWNYAR